MRDGKMKEELKTLIETWLNRAAKFRQIASEYYKYNNWEMGNVDSATSSAYNKAAEEAQMILDKYSEEK